MKLLQHSSILWSTLFLLLLWSCKQTQQWQGQAPIQKVSTLTKPIQKQYKGTFELGEGIYASNDFPGARLNGIVLNNDTLITALITAENTPINPSPWYAFKIWSDQDRTLRLKLTYSEGYQHRYYPKLSKDGDNWEPLAKEAYFPSAAIGASDERQLPKFIEMKITIGPDPLWIAAQELENSDKVNTWMQRKSQFSYVSIKKIGESRENRPINVLKIGNGDDQKMIMVISRQHPPEVTGYLAMKAFVEAICDSTELAKRFRDQYNTYVIPLMNPDGVDNGHWRHNSGGIDLNRDWESFNQVETQVARDFMKRKVAESGGQFYFGVDFHSTWEDIYYTIDPELKGNMPGLVPAMIEASAKELEDYIPNIRPGSMDGPKINSSRYFFHKFKAESLTFEIGDNTPRDLLKEKGRQSAIKLMELMTK